MSSPPEKPNPKGIPDHLTLENILTRDAGLLWKLRAQKLTPAQRSALLIKLEASYNQKQQRVLQLPFATIAENLPIHSQIESITDRIRNHQVIVLCGDTGSGKTTQLPKICLSCGLGSRGLIGHTQPRRIAARSVAHRIAQELDQTLGDQVGYKVRFDDRSDQNQFIKIMTDGILLTEIQTDPYLNEYQAIIIDEAHERSLNIDFILGHLQLILQKRRDLKLIITSATINPESFSKFFSQAPILNIPGKTFPVEHHFEDHESDVESSDHLTDRVRDLVLDILNSQDSGDILIFLPGERQIREISRVLHRSIQNRATLLPLYSRLSPQQQKQVFDSSPLPKVVLATNVAETSLTVPGIRYVIDSGLARISRYSIRSKIQRLPIEKVSQASIKQRAGRCGRTGPGVCFHLYTQQDHDQRPEYTEPEILRTNLAEVILRMLTSRLGKIHDFPFIDPPERKAINDGFRLLRDLNALNKKDQPTKTGKLMASFPLDPRLSRILVESKDRHCCREMVVIISALSIGDARIYPREQQEKAALSHRRFQHEKSDFIGFLNLWDYLKQLEKDSSSNQFKRCCEREFISYLRWREWKEMHNNLVRSIKKKDWVLNSRPPDYDTLHQCLLTGFIDHIGQFDKEEKLYRGLRNRSYIPHPQSYLKNSHSTWLMASTLIETSRVFAPTCAVIEPDWITRTARHLIKHTYSEPYWDEKSGFVRSTETASLHGLVLHANKKVSYERIDKHGARLIFIRNALATNRHGVNTEFARYNELLLQKLDSYAAKLRQLYLEPDYDHITHYLDQLIPEDVFSRHTFVKWLQDKNLDTKLRFPVDAVFHSVDSDSIDERYPNQLTIGDLQIPIRYEFNPDKDSDGIHLLIDSNILTYVNADYAEWTIQPWIHEKLNLILRSLTKNERKKIAPIDACIVDFLQQHSSFQCGLYRSLCNYLYENYAIKRSIKQLQEVALPAYLRPHFEIIQNHKIIAQVNDLDQIQRSNVQATHTPFAKKQNTKDKKRYTRWDMGVITESIEVDKGKHRITAYPALVDDRDAVVVQNFSSLKKADEAHLDGVIKLFELELNDTIKYIKKQLIKKSKLPLLYKTVDPNADVSSELIYFLIHNIFTPLKTLPRQADQFYQLIDKHKPELIPTAESDCDQLIRTLDTFRSCKASVEKAQKFMNPTSLQDIRSQLQHLLYSGFLYDVDRDKLWKIQHYLQALIARLEKAQQRPDTDAQRCQQIQSLWKAYCELDQWHSQQQIQSRHTTTLHWLLQDYRVHLFAQELQKEKISLKIIEKQLEQAKREKLLSDR